MRHSDLGADEEHVRRLLVAMWGDLITENAIDDACDRFMNLHAKED
jgi:hypothetical protein